MSNTVKWVVGVWLILMISTAVSAWGFSSPQVPAMVSTLAVMLIAAIKVGLVMLYFMDLRIAPRPWQVAGIAWVILAAGAVVGIYLM